MTHLCGRCGKWVSPQYTVDHERHHLGVTRSAQHKMPTHVVRTGSRSSVARFAVGIVKPVLSAVGPAAVAPVEKVVLEKKISIREFFVRLVRALKP